MCDLYIEKINLIKKNICLNRVLSKYSLDVNIFIYTKIINLTIFLLSKYLFITSKYLLSIVQRSTYQDLNSFTVKRISKKNYLKSYCAASYSI